MKDFVSLNETWGEYSEFSEGKVVVAAYDGMPSGKLCIMFRATYIRVSVLSASVVYCDKHQNFQVTVIPKMQLLQLMLWHHKQGMVDCTTGISNFLRKRTTAVISCYCTPSRSATLENRGCCP